jgi:hypothetical protein
MPDIDIVTLDENVLTASFTFNPLRWKSVPEATITTFAGLKEHIQEIKVYDSGEKNSQAFNALPDNIGGIYIFLIRPNVFFEYPYLVYIGEAGNNNTLKKRCNSYLTKSSADKRKWVKWLQDYYKDHWYIVYLPMSDFSDEEIHDFQNELIHALSPPYNDKSKKIIKERVSAFNF